MEPYGSKPVLPGMVRSGFFIIRPCESGTAGKYGSYTCIPAHSIQCDGENGEEGCRYLFAAAAVSLKKNSLRNDPADKGHSC